MSTEPTHFLNLVNNGKVFSSLDDMTCSYQCSDQFQFLAGHWQAKVLDFLRPWKNPVNLFKNNLNKTRNNSLKFKKKKWWNCGIINTNIFPKTSFSCGDKNIFGHKYYEEVVLNWRTNDHIMPRFGRSFIINNKCIFQ